jgi:hypothetical protein
MALYVGLDVSLKTNLSLAADVLIYFLCIRQTVEQPANANSKRGEPILPRRPL